MEAKYLFIAIILFTLIPFVRNNHWFFHAFDFFRIQIIYLGAVLLAASIFIAFPKSNSDWIVFCTFLLCMLYQCFRVFPYTFLAPVKSKACTGNQLLSISLISANVLQTNENKTDFIELLSKYEPDVFLTMESDKKWEEQLNQLEKKYPWQVKVPKNNLYGMHLYSRFELIDTEIRYLVDKEFPSIHTSVKLGKGKSLRLISLHPPPPSPTEQERSTERDGELMMVGREVSKWDNPCIVWGDLNDVAWSNTTTLFQKVSGLLDPRKGRGLYATFHAKYALLRAPIDHLFHSAHFYLKKIERLPKFGSDHFAMLYHLCLYAEADKQKEFDSKLNGDEEKVVDEMIKKST